MIFTVPSNFVTHNTSISNIVLLKEACGWWAPLLLPVIHNPQVILLGPELFFNFICSWSGDTGRFSIGRNKSITAPKQYQQFLIFFHIFSPLLCFLSCGLHVCVLKSNLIFTFLHVLMLIFMQRYLSLHDLCRWSYC